MSGSMSSAGQSVSISSNSGLVAARGEAGIHIVPFPEKRETFFDVHAGYSFPAFSYWFQLAEEATGFPSGMSCLCGAVDRNQPKGHGVAFLPFKVI